MIAGRSVLALITARGGSKGLPGKNIRDVLGRPLIQWTIDAARASRHIDRLVLSSDDLAIIAVAKAGGCDAPFRRPNHLATDTASSVDVALDALDRLPQHDILVLLQPTSPLRTAQDIDDALDLLVSSQAPACVTVRAAEDHPFWTYRTDPDGRLHPFVRPGDGSTAQRRQDLPEAWRINGAVYAVDIAAFRRTRSFLPEGTVALPMPAERSVDIDTLADLERMIALARPAEGSIFGNEAEADLRAADEQSEELHPVPRSVPPSSTAHSTRPAFSMSNSPEHPASQGLRVAIIGAGRMGARHLQAVQALGMDVVGVADIVEATLTATCEARNVPSSARFLDPVRMLQEARPQALVVATTAPTHALFVKAAVANDVRFILCEKPMAISLAETKEMKALCQAAGTQLAINHQMRFMPQYTQVKALIGTEALGPLVTMIVAGSNFGLAMNVSHFFEAFRYLTDTPVTTVQAWLESGQVPNPRGAQFEDRSGRLLASTDDGKTLYVDFSVDAGHGLQVVYTCRHGQIVADELSGDMRVVTRKPEFRELPTTRYCMPADVSHVPVAPVETVGPTVDVWRALLRGDDYPDGQAGAHAVACVVAAHVSQERGNAPVRLDDSALPNMREFKWA